MSTQQTERQKLTAQLDEKIKLLEYHENERDYATGAEWAKHTRKANQYAVEVRTIEEKLNGMAG